MTRKYLVTLMDDSQAQDREDSTYTYTVQAASSDEACLIALREEPANVYVISVVNVPAQATQ